MRSRVPALLLLLLPFAAFGGDARSGGAEGDGLAFWLSSWRPIQGEPVLVELSSLPAADDAAVVWKGEEFPMRRAGPGRFLGLVGVDLLEPPGKALLALWTKRGGETFRMETEVEIREGAFPVQELSLPKAMTEFDPPTLERINGEARRLAERFSRVSPPSWTLPFHPPVADYRPKGFGARRVINGEPRSPHAGVDVNLPAGTPVAATADGTVALAGEQFFGGNSVVLDHGGGVFSVYYHLREFIVSEGQKVSRGDRIGSVGESGRATGPHLHFGIRAAGGRIDPSLLLSLPSR